MPAMKPLVQALDGNFKPVPALTFGHSNALVLAAGTAKLVDIPAGANYVTFSPTDNFWVVEGAGPAVIPAVDIINGSSPEQNPTMKRLTKDVTQLSIISANAQVLNLTWLS
ncbi:NAD/NADP transhydrogenase alpha subunit-like protein [bacterium]|nr:NAD/NADP transhydrogenase alpha subunit-like protein [bacterium]